MQSKFMSGITLSLAALVAPGCLPKPEQLEPTEVPLAETLIGSPEQQQALAGLTDVARQAQLVSLYFQNVAGVSGPDVPQAIQDKNCPSIGIQVAQQPERLEKFLAEVDKLAAITREKLAELRQSQQQAGPK